MRLCFATVDFRDLMPDEHKKADRAAFEEAIKQLAEASTTLPPHSCDLDTAALALYEYFLGYVDMR